MKALFGLCLAGTAFGLVQPQLAQAVDVAPLSETAQLTVCGACMTIIFILVTRIIPRMAEKNNESHEKVAQVNREAVIEAAQINAAGMGELKDSVEGLRGDLQESQGEHLAFFREAFRRGKEGP